MKTWSIARSDDVWMARMIARIALILSLLALPVSAQAQQFGPAQFSIRADDGVLMSNHAVTPEHAAQLERLPGNHAHLQVRYSKVVN